MTETESMEKKVMRAITKDDYSRKELTQQITKWYGKDGKQALKNLWSDKMLYVSTWNTVRLSPRGWDKFSEEA